VSITPAALPPADLPLDPDAMGMQAHPEGGWYRETWRHELTTTTARGDRPLATCVAFLLRPGERSAWHRVASDELWLWQGGGPMLVTVGGFDDTPVPGFAVELRSGGQYLVRAGEWQTAEPATDRESLVACVVSPGFDFADLELAE
jgi:predicted cupin superfamily sugar epimerase